MTWHIEGLAKCIGAGLRAAYVVAPDAKSGVQLAAALRTATVMASPFTVALAARWIEDGTADIILRFIRAETAARQTLVAGILRPGSYRADPLSFNLSVPLPRPWTRSAFIGHMRSTGLGIDPSDAFVVSGDPGETMRACLGGPASREKISGGIELAHALDARHPDCQKNWRAAATTSDAVIQTSGFDGATLNSPPGSLRYPRARFAMTLKTPPGGVTHWTGPRWPKPAACRCERSSGSGPTTSCSHIGCGHSSAPPIPTSRQNSTMS